MIATAGNPEMQDEIRVDFDDFLFCDGGRVGDLSWVLMWMARTWRDGVLLGMCWWLW